MQLSKRLEAIASMVTPGNRLVDVGCDHGYLPIALVRRQIIPSAIAMDVRSGPLGRAKENIEAYGLNPYIETRLSDGLEALQPGEGDTLSVAGMGGPLIERILSRNVEVSESFQELILQPQSEIGNFRRYLVECGFTVSQEDMVWEDGKFYPIIKAVFKKTAHKDRYTDIEFYYGKRLLESRHPVLYSYLEKELEKVQQIARRLQASSTVNAKKRLREILKEKQRIEAAMRVYDYL